MNLIKLTSVAAMPLALASLAALVTPTLHAAPVPDDAAGIIKTAKGSVTIERAGRKSAGAEGAIVQASDRIITGADGSAGIALRDETRMALGPNTTLAMEHFAFNTTTHEGRLDASVRRGTLAVISGKIAKQSPTAVKFSTPSTVLGVRGTEFVIDVEGDGE